ncbi:MAG: hypothetical protein ABI454_12340 [Sphingomicrobium sp.]
MRDSVPSRAGIMDSRRSADLVSKLIAERRNPDPALVSHAERISAKVYGIMTATTLLTFGTLVGSYQLIFPHQLFA